MGLGGSVLPAAPASSVPPTSCPWARGVPVSESLVTLDRRSRWRGFVTPCRIRIGSLHNELEQVTAACRSPRRRAHQDWLPSQQKSPPRVADLGGERALAARRGRADGRLARREQQRSGRARDALLERGASGGSADDPDGYSQWFRRPVRMLHVTTGSCSSEGSPRGSALRLRSRDNGTSNDTRRAGDTAPDSRTVNTLPSDRKSVV